MRFPILVISLWLIASTSYSKIVFKSGRDGNSEIYVMSSTGGNQTRLTHNEVRDFSAAWSPNGRKIVFVRLRDENQEIYVMDADGGNQRNLTRHPAFESSPDWSPDGKQIAFSSDRDGALNVYVMDADGGNVEQLTRLKFATGPHWSPDGEQIAFQGVIDQGRQVYVMDTDGTRRWQVSEPVPGALMFAAGWSPDGTQILYKASIGGLVTNSTVIIATLSPFRGKVVKHEPVPLPKMDSTTVAWGADGKSILIALRKEGEKWDIYRFRLSDGQLTQLTDHPATDSIPNEWNSRLPVSPQEVAPKQWGEIKLNFPGVRTAGTLTKPNR